MRNSSHVVYFQKRTVGSKTAQRKFFVLLVVCLGWLLFGWLSLHDQLFEGLLWQTSKAAALTAETGVQPAKSAVALGGITYNSQTLNNCGPAVLAMNFSYYGLTLDQQTIAQTLRPNPDDENVRMDELANYAVVQGYQATLRVNGNDDLLKLFVSNGIPVVIEMWESDNPGDITDGFAHFRLVTGYDDLRQVWIVYDSYITRNPVNPQGAYQGIYVAYSQADQLWQIMNRRYLVIYTAAQAPLISSLIGANLDNNAMWKNSLAQAKAELAHQPNNAFAWFNLGSSLYASNLAGQAAQAFEKAQALGLPTHMFWYQYEPLEAYYTLGQYHKVISLIDANLTEATGIEEFYYWKAMALVALDEPSQAYQALEQSLVIKPNYPQALTTLDRGFGG